MRRLLQKKMTSFLAQDRSCKKHVSDTMARQRIGGKNEGAMKDQVFERKKQWSNKKTVEQRS